MGRKKLFIPFTILVLMVVLATMTSLAACSKNALVSSTPTSTATATTQTSPQATSRKDRDTFWRRQFFDRQTMSWRVQNRNGGMSRRWPTSMPSGGIMVKSLGKKLPVKLVFEDDESTPEGGAAAMEKLIKMDKVDFSSRQRVGSINDAAATVADKYKVYFAGSGGWWGEEFEGDNFQWASCMFFTAASCGGSPLPDLGPTTCRSEATESGYSGDERRKWPRHNRWVDSVGQGP